MRKFKKAVLHVGPDKTGSTAIQEALDVNRALLLDHGVFYPPGRGHAELGSCFCELPEQYIFNQLLALGDREQIAQRDGDYVAALRTALERSEGEILVLSYEGFVNLDEKALEGLRQFIGEYAAACEVVYYARAPLAYAASGMGQRVKLGFRAAPDNHPPIQPHRVFIQRLVGVFGKEQVKVRKFAKEALQQGDVVTDFLSLLELPAAVCDEVAKSRSRKNPALSAEGVLIGERIIELLESNIPSGPFFRPILQKFWRQSEGRKSDSARRKRKRCNKRPANIAIIWKESSELPLPLKRFPSTMTNT